MAPERPFSFRFGLGPRKPCPPWPTLGASRCSYPTPASSWGQQAARLLKLVRSQRDITRMIENDLLTFAAQHEAYEFVERRRQRLARRLVDVQEGEAAQRIGCERDILVSRRLGRLAGFRQDRNHLHARIQVSHTRVAEAVAVRRDVLRHRKDDLLEFDVVA